MPGIGELSGQGSRKYIVVPVRDHNGWNTFRDHIAIAPDDIEVFITFADIDPYINKIFIYQFP